MDKRVKRILLAYRTGVAMSVSLVLLYLAFIVYLLFTRQWHNALNDVFLESKNYYLLKSVASLFFITGFTTVLVCIRWRVASSRIYYFHRDNQRYTVASAAFITVSFMMYLFCLLQFLRLATGEAAIFNYGVSVIAMRLTMSLLIIIICVKLMGAISWRVIISIVILMGMMSLVWLSVSLIEIYSSIVAHPVLHVPGNLFYIDFLILVSHMLIAVCTMSFAILYLLWLRKNELVKRNINPSVWGIPYPEETNE
jgi:hypothetical protein